MNVEVVYGASIDEQELIKLDLENSQATVLMALEQSGVLVKHQLVVDALECGVWNRQVRLDHLLQEGDRIEIYRALLIDPKEARRLRAAKRQC
ncbi:rnfH ubiquitin family protein [Piscirickettsia salmonis]|uniref:UPF0125 protein Psal009_03230 n=1 Tax=Piscirickettsia salmonis TaxID=1238 RepID=A0A9Q5VGA9_PISSA|nr:RnfH family protein [Piscirickettsia salmonis]ALA23755.1 ubiquitin family protein RnfH [Piscirickettsia salmonis]APS44185.1 rnfH ubiquitin family protein [Piscirickettsia salmonis]APS47545.1 rnfH ubiquitin family protein [Piscirickettsia salmonis]APS51021.1 rnfH ubiquitin family protein [Piscirickettsia salmonis]APS54227.1 rnfH ubiquitin family protein [Piscirickettsia salmonis]